MAYVTTNYQIASGYNNAAGLVLITSLTDGTNTFVEPTGLFTQRRGRREVRGNGIVGRSGFQSSQLISDMLVSQYWYLVDNYEGFVTVKIPVGSTTWANYNAILSLPDPAEMEQVSFAGSDHEHNFVGPGFRSVQWSLSRLAAI
ncbi:MAG: hypothetical protein ACYS80_16365 [Planctomycetota bacterium]|jgi:hypothetical protein